MANMVTVKSVITLAPSKDWTLYQMDVFNVFLQGDLFEEVYINFPQGFQRQWEQKVCKLLKSIYGLKQASMQKNLKLTKAFVSVVFIHNTSDYFVFTKKSGTNIVVILIYVDDILLTGSSKELINEAKTSLHQEFKLKNLGELRYFLGIEVLRSKHAILINQRKYTLELMPELGLRGANPALTPLEINQKLTTVEYDEAVGLKDIDPLTDFTSYQRLICKLLYLTISRPNIRYALQSLS